MSTSYVTGRIGLFTSLGRVHNALRNYGTRSSLQYVTTRYRYYYNSLLLRTPIPVSRYIYEVLNVEPLNNHSGTGITGDNGGLIHTACY